MFILLSLLLFVGDIAAPNEICLRVISSLGVLYPKHAEYKASSIKIKRHDFVCTRKNDNNISFLI